MPRRARARAAPRAPGGGAGGACSLRQHTASSRETSRNHASTSPLARNARVATETERDRCRAVPCRDAQPLPPALPTTMLKRHLGITPEYPSAERSGKAVQGHNLAPPD